MKKFLLVMVASLAFACGGDDDNNNNGTKEDKCSAEGDQKCSDDKTQRLTCNGTVYKVTDTCAAPQVCEKPSTAARVFCEAPVVVGEGEECDSESDCEAGLDCIQNFCSRGCTGLPDCEEGEACVAVSETASICIAASSTGEPCFGVDQCGVEGDDCVLSFEINSEQEGPDLGVCGVECDAVNIGTGQATCPTGLVCLQNPGPYLDVESDTACTDDANCTVAEGFACMDLNIGKRCSRYPGLCGTQIPFLDPEVTTIDDAHACNTFNGAYCGVVGATGEPALTFCDVIDAPIAPQLPADLGVGYCLGLCDPDVDTDLALDCGQGAVCGEPLAVERTPFIHVQENEGEDVICTADCGETGICADEACDGENGYQCFYLDGNCGDLTTEVACSSSSDSCSWLGADGCAAKRCGRGVRVCEPAE